MRKVFAVVLIALCTWYAKHVMITVDSVIQQFNRFVHTKRLRQGLPCARLIVLSRFIPLLPEPRP